MAEQGVVIIGAGVGGLAAAIDLARAGRAVTVVERGAAPGGKMRRIQVAGLGVDAGPTVFTMRWVFDGLLAGAGTTLEEHLALHAPERLARHGWEDGSRLDLWADKERSAAAIEAFADAQNAQGYLDFCERSADVYATLRDSFIDAQRPNPLSLVGRVGLHRLPAMFRIQPFKSLWGVLGEHFTDPRLRQLFGRYATYVGSSPLAAPATLMLVAHVEQDGVWLLRGGMQALAHALKDVGESLGVRYRFETEAERIEVHGGAVTSVTLVGGERLPAERVVFNGDASALGRGLLGNAALRATRPVDAHRRSLSAVTWCLAGRPEGFPLDFHNVFFGCNYPAEFKAIFRDRTITATPTVYLCAQDRGPWPAAGEDRERMLLLVNAPADGDRGGVSDDLLAELQQRVTGLLERCGLSLALGGEDCRVTRPQDFEALFPGSGGALYGRASHGPLASFARPAARSRVRGLYLAGGSAHPGAGVPMAALSGRLAAQALLND
ncbi:1-hydroxycarotenoid 3,4-desaturase CrtD [Pseudohaliea rubra]|uniref:Methoxyneurosporene dehydrogenase n=1 Tax=Pseudohaliea rubra DSM 19751 TaxID=1265313 RepID=A0A095XTZ5_9GAMM|nr:1-hydroxycarotenoid 3,4-desaturase CrtD [Pseudohaliea rubra]KGE03111.1 Methoxyneurosporene dehydrogenase [Pseudohaliea rubra DSM 19751]